MQRVLRETIPVDDKDHIVDMQGDILRIAATFDSRGVEFWFLDHPQTTWVSRTFHVFGTGHAIPLGYKYIGTCQRTDMNLVWHLFEKTHAE